MLVTITRQGKLIGQLELATALDIHGITPSKHYEPGNAFYAIQECLCDLWPYECLDGVVLEMVQ